MLKEASVSDLRSRDIPKESRILVNRGRGNDELAPSDALYKDFNTSKTRLEKGLGKGSAEAHNDLQIPGEVHFTFFLFTFFLDRSPQRCRLLCTELTRGGAS